MRSHARFSRCRKYRYRLRRTWNPCLPPLGIIGLNPSTADAKTDDPTVRKCVRLADAWGYGGIVLVNLFAWRATDRSDLKSVVDPVGPRNDREIRAALSCVSDTLAAWGNDGSWLNRAGLVRELLRQLSVNCYCIRQNRTGAPVHPLYQKNSSVLQTYVP